MAMYYSWRWRFVPMIASLINFMLALYCIITLHTKCTTTYIEYACSFLYVCTVKIRNFNTDYPLGCSIYPLWTPICVYPKGVWFGVEYTPLNLWALRWHTLVLKGTWCNRCNYISKRPWVGVYTNKYFRVTHCNLNCKMHTIRTNKSFIYSVGLYKRLLNCWASCLQDTKSSATSMV